MEVPGKTCVIMIALIFFMRTATMLSFKSCAIWVIGYISPMFRASRNQKFSSSPRTLKVEISVLQNRVPTFFSHRPYANRQVISNIQLLRLLFSGSTFFSLNQRCFVTNILVVLKKCKMTLFGTFCCCNFTFLSSSCQSCPYHHTHLTTLPSESAHLPLFFTDQIC